MEQNVTGASVVRADKSGNAETARLRQTSLIYILAAEFTESFAYWGVMSLLVLYMRKQLLVTRDFHAVFGLQPIIDLTTSGPVSIARVASAIFGLFTGFAMLTPIAGGLIADRWLGRTRTIALGAAFMAAGHVLLTFNATFLVALLCLVIGVGCFKANITSQVGELFEVDDPKRQGAFSLLLLSTNVSGIIAPLVCGLLAEKLGWHWGFGAGATVMLMGFAFYLWARRRLARFDPNASATARVSLSRPELRKVVLLAFLLFPLALTQLSNHQLYNAYLVWAQQTYRLRLFGFDIPVTWLLSFDNVLVVTLIAAVARFWLWWDGRFRQIDDLTKIAVATIIAAAGPVTLAMLSAAAAHRGHSVVLAWAIVFHFFNDLGFAIMIPAGWSLYTRVAPSLTGFLIGLYSIHLFFANLLVAWLGGLLETMRPETFWLLHASLMGAGAAILLLIRGGVLLRQLALGPELPHRRTA